MGNVKSARPKTLDETIELANDLMNQKLRTYAERSDNKRKTDDSSRNDNGHQQQPFKKQNVARVYNMGTGVLATQMLLILKKGNGAAPKGNGCFECGAPGHFKRDCPKWKNKNGGKRKRTRLGVYGWRRRDEWERIREPRLQCRHGYIPLKQPPFDTGADRSFISTTFSSMVDIVSTPLDNSYNVELADGKIVRIDTILRGLHSKFLKPSVQHRPNARGIG
ncbi:putative reverse transcriptase domain-containing protein [Tanacetum coccineum]